MPPIDARQPPAAPPRVDDPHWQALLERCASSPIPSPASPLHALYAPLLAARAQGPFAVGHLAQSLDGRIAISNGRSRWLSGAEDLLHTHRMRAIADAVLVGAGTVRHDDPQLTVRLCAGASPVRVVIDPERRLDGSQRVFRDGTAPTLLLVAADHARAAAGADPGPVERQGLAEVVPLPRAAGGALDPHAIRQVLAARGLRWLFIEGGGVTVSRFLAAGALDRLQITVAPVILGSGRPGIALPEITDLRHSLRPRSRRFTLGEDVMIECDFRG